MSSLLDPTPEPDREVPLADDNDLVVLPDQTRDDQIDPADRRRGSKHDINLLEDRPPHWDY